MKPIKLFVPLILSGIFSVTCLPVFSIDSKENTFDFNAFYEHISARRYFDAWDAIRNLAETDNDLQLKSAHCIALFKMGFIETAKLKAEEILECKPDRAEGHFILGNYYYSLNQPLRALDHLKKSLTSEFLKDSTYKLIIRIHSEQGDLASEYNALVKYIEHLETSDKPVSKKLKISRQALAGMTKESNFQIHGDVQKIELRLVKRNGAGSAPAVPIILNGKESFPFDIDTTYPGFLILSSQLAETVNVKTQQISDEHHGGIVASYGRLDEIRMGSLKISNIPVTVLDDPIFSGGEAGIIGTGFLKRFNGMLDLNTQRIALYPRNRSEVFQQEIANEDKSVPIQFFITDSIRVSTTVGMQPAYLFALSTAAPANLLDEKVYNRFMTINPINDNATLFINKDQSPIPVITNLPIKIDNHSLPAQNFAVVDLHALLTSSRCYTAGIIGSELFKPYRLYFDFDHCLLHLIKR